MIRKTFVLGLLAAAVGTLATGVVSYWKGVPGETIWINSLVEKPRVHVALIDGILHAVYAKPLDQPSFGNSDSEFGPFYVKRVFVGNTMASGVGAPFWSLFALFMIGPTVACVRGPLRRRRRRKRGECIHCGYNLTGLIEPRCPECGRQFAPAIGDTGEGGELAGQTAA